MFLIGSPYVLFFLILNIGTIGTAQARDLELHTHFRGVLSSSEILTLAFNERTLEYPVALLESHGIELRRAAVYERDGQKLIPFRRENFPIPQQLEHLLGIGNSNSKANFSQLERAYTLRKPLLHFSEKNSSFYRRIVEEIARKYRALGVTYAEISSPPEILSPPWGDFANQELPRIEKSTGVRLRFLVGLKRDAGSAVIQSSLPSVSEQMARTHYLVGVDFLGEELNPTKDFAAEIRQFRSLEKQFPYIQVRVHAGETNAFPQNVREAILAGATRIGHGVYGMDDATLALAREKGVIIETNPRSNEALGNVLSLEELPIRRLLANNVRVTLGTDGPGIFGATPMGERHRVAALGLSNKELAKIDASDEAYRRFILARGNFFGKKGHRLKSCPQTFASLTEP